MSSCIQTSTREVGRIHAWRLPLAVCLSLLRASNAALPPGYEDELFCPPGTCQRRKAMPSGFVGPASQFKECVSYADVSNASSPTGWGSKLGSAKRQELVDAGWHKLVCPDNLAVCPFEHMSAEWATCTVSSEFLLKMLGELKNGQRKSREHVRSMLSPYLGSASGIARAVPNDVPKDFTPGEARQDLLGLYNGVDLSAREIFESSNFNATQLAEAILNELNFNYNGDLIAQSKDSKEDIVKQLFQRLFEGRSGWKDRYRLKKEAPIGRFVLIGVLVALAVIICALARFSSTKKPRGDD